jgi:hypothetical protein
LLVGLSGEGELIFEEDREGAAFGARIKDRYFLNGARHSLYYKRYNDTTILLVRYFTLYTRVTSINNPPFHSVLFLKLFNKLFITLLSCLFVKKIPKSKRETTWGKSTQ